MLSLQDECSAPGAHQRKLPVPPTSTTAKKDVAVTPALADTVGPPVLGERVVGELGGEEIT